MATDQTRLGWWTVIYRVLIFILLFVVGADAEIQRLVISNFSGGINRSASDVQLNQCWDMVDMNLDSRGAMGPRRGFKYLSLAADSTLGRVIHGLIPYNIIGNKHLLIQRHGPIAFRDTSKMTYTTIQSGTKDSTLSELNAVRDNVRPRTGVHAITWQKNMWIASAGSELQVYDGTRMFPARPLGPAQPSAVALDNDIFYTTTLTGTYSYKYNFIDGPSVSNLSAPSFPVQVTDGAIYVSGIIGPDSTIYNGTSVYRSKDGGPYFLHALATGTLFSFVDTVPVAPLDSVTYPYGNRPRCVSGESWNSTEVLVPTPGAIIVDSVSYVPDPDSGYGINCCFGYPLQDTILASRVMYSVVYLDTLGRRSYMSPPTCAEWWHYYGLFRDSAFHVNLSNILPPPDTFSIVARLLLRSFAPHICDSCDYLNIGLTPGCYNVGDYFVIDTIRDHSITSLIDSMPACSTNIQARFYCGEFLELPNNEPDSVSFVIEETYLRDRALGDNPEDDCLDSVISFKPTVIIQREGQAFAIGHPEFPNRIYYSMFYDPGVGWTPSTWVIDKFFDLPSKSGDWFIALALLNGDIYGFRQHSVVKISGFSFYQYQVRTISEDVGALSPRSVTSGGDRIYFADKQGIYETTGGKPNKISTAIDSLWFKNFSPALGIGNMVKGEYWLQTQISSVGTLVYNPIKRSWRRHDVTYSHILDYDTDLTNLDWSPTEVIIVRGDDSLYQRNNVGNLDQWDAVGVCSYTSQEFFQEPAREKIHYIDILGQGILDSIVLRSYREGFKRLVPDLTYSSITWGNQSSSSVRVRFNIDEIVPAYRFKIDCYPQSSGTLNTHAWSITSIVIGWQPWDDGRVRR